MQSGKLTVTGEGESFILLTARPRETTVVFVLEQEPVHVPCDPRHHGHHRDHLEHRVEHEDEDKREHHKAHLHHHHDRQFFLFIKWRVTGVREIDWFVRY
jgi:hypothetical protein